MSRKVLHQSVTFPAGQVELEGELDLPLQANGIVLFVHGSGSGRNSPRNQFVAGMIRAAGLGTLLFDLLTADEEARDARDQSLRFNIPLLTRRLIGATQWLTTQPEARGLPLGYFGASTGAAAALVAAAELGAEIAAVVSRGGRPDLACASLSMVRSATLLIVGGLDEIVIGLNEKAYDMLRCEKEFRIVPGATHLFEEPGRLEQVGQLSAHWFAKHLGVAS